MQSYHRSSSLNNKQFRIWLETKLVLKNHFNCLPEKKNYTKLDVESFKVVIKNFKTKSFYIALMKKYLSRITYIPEAIIWPRMIKYSDTASSCKWPQLLSPTTVFPVTIPWKNKLYKHVIPNCHRFATAFFFSTMLLEFWLNLWKRLF